MGGSYLTVVQDVRAVEIMDVQFFFHILDEFIRCLLCIILDLLEDRGMAGRGRGVEEGLAEHGCVEGVEVHVFELPWLRAGEDAEHGYDEGDDGGEEGNYS